VHATAIQSLVLAAATPDQEIVEMAAGVDRRVIEEVRVLRGRGRGWLKTAAAAAERAERSRRGRGGRSRREKGEQAARHAAQREGAGIAFAGMIPSQCSRARRARARARAARRS